MRTRSGTLRCLRGGYYMREEVRERIFTIHPVLYDVRAGCEGILLLAVHDRDAMGYAMGL